LDGAEGEGEREGDENALLGECKGTRRGAGEVADELDNCLDELEREKRNIFLDS
jgi:hypothetical protein